MGEGGGGEKGGGGIAYKGNPSAAGTVFDSSRTMHMHTPTSAVPDSDTERRVLPYVWIN